jgi:hypothetical protein
MTNFGSANARYSLLPELALNGGINYRQVDYNYSYLPTAQTAPTKIKDMQLYSGIQYQKNYRPEILDPFTLKSSYDLTLGRANVTSATAQTGQSGLYYQNGINLGLHSTGWKQDDAYLEYSYLNRRDHSPLKNNLWSHNYHLGVSTARVPRTTISGNAYYISQHTSSGLVPASFINYMSPGTQMQNRSLTFNATLSHSLTAYLNFDLGASQGNSSASTTYTLATLQPPGTDINERTLFGGLNMNYKVTRQLTVRATVREEIRDAKEKNGNTLETTMRQATAGIDYRFRMIIVNTDYLLREDTSKSQPRSVQQSFILKATRPF